MYNSVHTDKSNSHDLLFYELYVADSVKFDAILKCHGDVDQLENLERSINLSCNVQLGAYGQN